MLDKTQSTLNFDKSIILGQKQTAVKFRMFCKEDNVDSVLATEITPIINTLKTAEGVVDIAGKVTAKILVREQNGIVGGMSYTVDLSDRYDNSAITSNSILTSDCTVVEYDVNVEGAEVTVNAVIGVEIRIFERTQVACLQEGNLECRFETVTHANAIAKVEEVFSASAQLEIKDDIARVLSSQSNVVVSAVNISDKIMTVEGEVILNLVYVPTNEDLPQSVLMPFGFTQEISVAENGVALITAIAKSTKIRLEVFEDQKNSVFTVETLIGVDGVLFEEREQSVIADCFSTTNAISTQNATGESSVPKGLYCVFAEIEDDIQVSTEDDWQFVGVFCQEISILNTQAVTDGIEVTGIIDGDLLFKSGDGFISQKTENPFSITLNVEGVMIGDIVDLRGAIKQCDLRFDAGTIHAQWKVAFVVNLLRNVTVSFVADVEEGENLTDAFGAIEVSLAFAGDSLWEVAKNLNMSIGELKSLNPELTDPIETNQKLVVYHRTQN